MEAHIIRHKVELKDLMDRGMEISDDPSFDRKAYADHQGNYVFRFDGRPPTKLVTFLGFHRLLNFETIVYARSHISQIFSETHKEQSVEFHIECSKDDCKNKILTSEDIIPDSFKKALEGGKCSTCVPAGSFTRKG